LGENRGNLVGVATNERRGDCRKKMNGEKREGGGGNMRKVKMVKVNHEKAK